MGREAEDVLASLKLTGAQKHDYDAVTTAFGRHFVPRTNVIYERLKFNRRVQEAHETVDAFVTDLYKLAEVCAYGDLEEELIRDQFVVGLVDVKLSEQLQLNPEVTLETAISKARNSETVKQQLKELRPQAQPNAIVDELHFSAQRAKNKKQLPVRNKEQNQACRWCGSTRPHLRAKCPAADKTCNGCGKKGHFVSMCLSTKKKTQDSQSQRHAALEEVYLGKVTSQLGSEPWRITACVNGSPVEFKVDTGADVTAIPSRVYNKSLMGPLSRPTKALLGPGRAKIPTVGQFKATLRWNGRSCQEQVFVVDNLHDALLGCPAIKSLQVLCSLSIVEGSEVDEDDTADIFSDYPKLTAGLGLLNTEYKVTLLPNAKPYAVTYPRRVPLPSVKQELERMASLGVIAKVDHATEWCAPMVVARKKNGELRICVDYSGLNSCILRE